MLEYRWIWKHQPCNLGKELEKIGICTYVSEKLATLPRAILFPLLFSDLQPPADERRGGRLMSGDCSGGEGRRRDGRRRAGTNRTGAGYARMWAVGSNRSLSCFLCSLETIDSRMGLQLDGPCLSLLQLSLTGVQIYFLPVSKTQIRSSIHVSAISTRCPVTPVAWT